MRSPPTEEAGGESRSVANSGRLYLRFLTIFVPVVLACALLALAVFVRQDGRAAHDELSARVGNHAARVAGALARHWEASERVVAQDLAETLLSDRAVECVAFHPAGGGRGLVAPEGLGCVGSRTTESLSISIPADEGEHRLEVRFSTAEVDTARMSRFNFTLLALGASILIALLASFLGFRIIVGRPLARLLRAIRTMGARASYEPVPVTTSDELGTVIGAFNEMHAKLAEQERQRLAHIAALREEIALREKTERALTEAYGRAEATAEELQHLANHDGLTGLLKRERFENLVGERLAALGPDPSDHGCLVFCDIDKFKAINDTHGHAVGDDVIRVVAGRLSAHLGKGDLACRIGGDEFVIYLAGRGARTETLAVVHAMAADLIGRDVALKSGPEGAPELLPLTTSLGVAMAPDDAVALSELMQRADLALYAAKEQGRGRVAVFEPSLEAERATRIIVETELVAAMARGQLELHYQPIVDLDTGAITTYEALMRWRHPMRGLLSPGDFLDAADRCGLLPRLCEWTLETACHDAAAWREPRIVAVNVSPSQLQGLDLPAIVAEVLRRTGLPAERLELEITEQVLLDRGEATLAKVAALETLGVRVALDDFGTGHASLSLLPFVSWDRVKVDRSFMRLACVCPKSNQMLTLIVDLCRSMNFAVTVEGIETVEQLGLLAGRPRLSGQGYLFGRAQRIPVEQPAFVLDAARDRRAA